MDYPLLSAFWTIEVAGPGLSVLRIERNAIWRNLVGLGASAPAALDEASTTTMRSSSASSAEVLGFIY
ncbi:hypothetical protein MXD62_33205 [Frankia sp. Mgl5]|uniref:hypothetical protein n=1 Tax=Frankia sp. Mgl5 TaxID=2933793 RepID=UPI00200EDF1D|nr:hypothetical protein [Frankia sp. Mgl5]MCK9931939.1 hypothetical protein [Frankia sp. Mgl5]